MYKIYQLDDAFCVDTLAEVREMTGASDAQIKKLFVSRVMSINGFDVINYNN